MADIDTISKYLIQHYPDHFTRFALARDDVEVIEVIETEQPTVRARRSDSFIRVRINGQEALVHNEFQTTDSTNPPMERRMAGYIGYAIEHHGLPIYSNVIYLRPNAGQNDPGYYVQELPGYEIAIRYRVIRLIEIEGQRILSAGHSGLIPFTPLMKPPEGMASDAWLHRCIHIEDLLDVLEIRFDMPETHPLTARIAAIDDLQHLKQLHRAAIQVPNLEAFQRVLDA